MSAWADISGEHVRLAPLERRCRDAIVATLKDQNSHFTTVDPAQATFDGWHETLERETAPDRIRAFTAFDSPSVICGLTRYIRLSETGRRLQTGGTVYARQVRRTGLNIRQRLRPPGRGAR